MCIQLFCLHYKTYIMWFCVTSVLLSTTDRKVVVLLCVALGAFLATVEAGRRGPPGIPGRQPISCNSYLVRSNPQAYPHCCSPGPWKFVNQTLDSTCPSGRRYVLKRTTCPGMYEIKTPCESIVCMVYI